jgi:hypothetical protein
MKAFTGGSTHTLILVNITSVDICAEDRGDGVSVRQKTISFYRSASGL